MRRSTERRVLYAAAVVLLASVRCTTDHDALAKRDRETAGAAGGGGKASGGQGGGGFGATGAFGGKYSETPGDNRVTFLHGVADAERIAFCFGDGQPTPESGLRFGESLSFDSIAGVDLAGDDLSTFVLAGDLSLVEGLDCEEARAKAEQLMLDAMPEWPEPPAGGAAGAAGAQGSAGSAGSAGAESSGGAGGAPSGSTLPPAPALRVRELAVFPAGTLSGGLSYLVVAAGCVGGPWFTHKSDDLVCGAGYEGDTTLSPVLVTLSRQPTSFLGLQVLHASRATGEIDLRVGAEDPELDAPTLVARDLTEGAIAPRPPRLDGSRATYGVDANVNLEVVQDGAVVLAVPWDRVLDNGGLDDVADGQNYSIVLIGARPKLGVTEWWNSAALTIVANGD